MGPLISAAQLERVQAHVDRALDDGAKLVTGGGRPAGLDGGFYFEPTILTEVTPEATIAQEEVFGPVLSVLRYRDDDDAVRIANNSQYGLSGAVWGTDVDRAVAVARRIRTGQIAVNGFGPGGAPFGGFKQSGFGRESGGIDWDFVPVHGAEGHWDLPAGEGAHDGALDGLRVVEIADEISGPYCGKLFADLGAEVTKIEAPEGDSLRQWGPFPATNPTPTAAGCSSTSMPESAARSWTSRVKATRQPLVA